MPLTRPSRKGKSLTIRQSKKEGVYVAGLTELTVENEESIVEYIEVREGRGHLGAF